MKKKYDYSEWYSIVEPILLSEEYLKRKSFRHHGDTSVYDHCVKVSKYSYRVAKRLKLDYRGAAIAGILHDFYVTPWQDTVIKQPFFQKHGFTHAADALINSQIYYSDYLNDAIENAILRHMFPLNFRPPKCKIGYVVTLCDKCASLDFLKSKESLKKTFGIR